MVNAETIDIRGDAFAKRLANLLTDRREASGATIRRLARTSDGAFTSRFLRSAENGRAELDEETVCQLAALYGAELAEILPSRLPLRIEVPDAPGTGSGPETLGESTLGESTAGGTTGASAAARVAGIVSTSGISAEFDPHDSESLLTSYLLLVRQLRAQQSEPLIVLRREDVETIAEYLHEDGPSVVERLSTLMGATRLQRRAMVGLFVAGALVIGLAGSGVAALNGSEGVPPRPPAQTVSVVETVGVPASTLSVEVSTTVRPSDPPIAGTSAVDAQPTGPGSEVPTSSATTEVTVDPGSVTIAPAPAPVIEGTPSATQPSAPVISAAPPTAPLPPATSPVVRPVPPPVSAAPPERATGAPPVPETPEVGVADPPLVPESSEPVLAPPPADLTIPYLPYDPPPTTGAPAVATTPPPVPEPAPETTTADPPTTTEPEVATGEPPLPPP